MFSQHAEFWKLQNITWAFPSFSWGVFSQTRHLDQSHTSKNDYNIINGLLRCILPGQQALMCTPTEDGQPLYLPAVAQENKASWNISQTADSLSMFLLFLNRGPVVRPSNACTTIKSFGWAWWIGKLFLFCKIILGKAWDFKKEGLQCR